MSVTPTAFYKDPKRALDWLAKAFGFETSLLLEDSDGNVGHAEMAFGDAHIGVGGEWNMGPAQMKSPQSLGGCSQFIWLDLTADLDAHCERARSAGARIIAEPETQFYGARTYRALDPEGHVWCFSMAVREVPRDEMERASGLRFKDPA